MYRFNHPEDYRLTQERFAELLKQKLTKEQFEVAALLNNRNVVRELALPAFEIGGHVSVRSLHSEERIDYDDEADFALKLFKQHRRHEGDISFYSPNQRVADKFATVFGAHLVTHNFIAIQPYQNDVLSFMSNCVAVCASMFCILFMINTSHLPDAVFRSYSYVFLVGFILLSMVASGISLRQSARATIRPNMWTFMDHNDRVLRARFFDHETMHGTWSSTIVILQFDEKEGKSK
jgi:hypothetical protein